MGKFILRLLGDIIKSKKKKDKDGKEHTLITEFNPTGVSLEWTEDDTDPREIIEIIPSENTENEESISP